MNKCLIIVLVLTLGIHAGAAKFDVNAGGRVPGGANSTFGMVTFKFTVAGLTMNLADINVNLDVVHDWTEDLRFTLSSPDGSINVRLFDHRGSVPAFANLDDTYLDDAAANAISTGAPPFAGSFKPEQALSAFNGMTPAQANGDWMLTVDDNQYGSYGWLYRKGDAKFETRRAVKSGTFLEITQVPEPSSFAALALGALLFLKRRRR